MWILQELYLITVWLYAGFHQFHLRLSASLGLFGTGRSLMWRPSGLRCGFPFCVHRLRNWAGYHPPNCSIPTTVHCDASWMNTFHRSQQRWGRYDWIRGSTENAVYSAASRVCWSVGIVGLILRWTAWHGSSRFVQCISFMKINNTHTGILAFNLMPVVRESSGNHLILFWSGTKGRLVRLHEAFISHNSLRHCQNSSSRRSQTFALEQKVHCHLALQSLMDQDSRIFKCVRKNKCDAFYWNPRSKRAHSILFHHICSRNWSTICYNSSSIMCNASIKEGYLPASQKFALVTPVIKKPSLDPDVESNYRPISNLTLISKVIERLISRQINDHLKRQDLMPVLQSAYRPGHSTESCILKVVSDILDAADSGQVSLIGLLDLSAAFDTVDHDILLRRMELSFGITGAALNWIRSFLSERTQSVTFFGERSSIRKLACGVPQGSVLGPLLFILYTADVIHIAGSMGVRVHCYADDTQLYISGSERDAASTMSRITDCIDAISLWMSSNRLKLNGDKTQFIWLGSRQRLTRISKDNLVIQGAEISPLDSVRDLGVIIDCKLTMEDHVNSVVKSCFFQLRQLRSIRRSLPTDARKALVHSFVASRIDYCNAILYGVSDGVVRRMQTALNAAARLVVDAGRRQHMTPILQSLHWLPVEATNPLQDRHTFLPLRPWWWTGLPHGDVFKGIWHVWPGEP